MKFFLVFPALYTCLCVSYFVCINGEMNYVIHKCVLFDFSFQREIWSTSKVGVFLKFISLIGSLFVRDGKSGFCDGELQISILIS